MQWENSELCHSDYTDKEGGAKRRQIRGGPVEDAASLLGKPRTP